MVHPLLVTEIAVRNFISQWYIGLRPSIQLTTNPDGSVTVTSKVSSCNEPKKCAVSPKYRRHRRSGHDSRFRRKMKRIEKNQKNLIDDDSNFVNNETNHIMEEESRISLSDPSNSTQVDAAVQVASPTSDAFCEPVPCLQQPPRPASKKPNLIIMKTSSTSLPPRPIYHPAVINASKSMHGKHPSELNREEADKLKQYMKWKCDRGEPVETDVIHVPSDMRDCLHCGYPT